jgi:hypothetical protein
VSNTGGIVNKLKTAVTLLAAMMLSVGLAPAAFADGDDGSPGQGPAVYCDRSYGQVTDDAKYLLGGGVPDGNGSSCNSVGIGEPGEPG